jgi:hypothetical protein
MRQIDELQPANKNIATTTTWKWHDNNHNRSYEPGEVNLDPNGTDYVSAAVRDSGVFSNDVPNPAEKEPWEWGSKGSGIRWICVSRSRFRSRGITN